MLVFCSGVGEIKQAMEAIRDKVRGKVDVMPLHANLSPAEQRKVFEPQRAGSRKIVVATNVAETSITMSAFSGESAKTNRPHPVREDSISL